MFYLLYQITNKLDGKIYVGVHKTTNMNDGYMGSGNRIQNALKKYGKDNFEKTILEYHTNYDDLLRAEANIVNEEFINSDNTYNLKTGGHNGSPSIETRKKQSISIMKYEESLTDEQRETRSCETKQRIKRAIEHGYDPGAGMRGKSHSENAKQLIGQANAIHQRGSGNSQYGTHWVYNLDLELEQCKQIPKIDIIPVGWVKGRIKNFTNYKSKIHKRQVKEKRKIAEEKKTINQHIEWYELYCKHGFIEFCNITEYNKTQANLVTRFKKLVPSFKPQMGRPRIQKA